MEILQESPVYTISIAAQLVGVSADRLRTYEEEGLFKPFRDEKGNRLFSQNDIKYLMCLRKFIHQYALSIKGLALLFEHTTCAEIMKKVDAGNPCECHFMINVGTKSMNDLIISYEQAISRIVLYSVNEISPTDINGIVDFLKGDENRHMKEYNLYDKTAYSVLSTLNKESLKRIIFRLKELKLLQFQIKPQSQMEMDVVKVTKEGLNFLNNDSVIKTDIMKLLR